MWSYGPHNANPTMWMGMGFGLIVLLILLALAVWMIIAASRRQSANTPSQSSNRPVETLKERYARGEIGTEEYRERMRELEGDKRG
ncbi:SHOCT domain-containing protein [Planomicrobium okeanokoites]|uniref:SHOCT domain-containing protein n=1 Tax=Planomicrobium okeanokoites TaxID=244 RepID=A0ABV7KLC0_PLAOK|nr:SHOCT domain-containing protein [Planomicrobium okeanokoites]